MNPMDVKKMRRKQFTTINVLLLITTVLYIGVTRIFHITFTQLFMALGIIVLCQAMIALIKGDSIKSIIPIFEQVAKYEKEKMGNEWVKQQRSNIIWKLVLAGMFFVQAYLHVGKTDKFVQIDLSFWLFIIPFIILLMNFSLWMYIRKIDDSKSELDLKGYAWKTNVRSIFIGIVFAFITITVTMWFVLTRI